MRRQRREVSRRTFLKGVGIATAASAAAALTAGCATNAPAAETVAPPGQSPVPVPLQYPEAPYTPTEPPPPGLLRVLTPHEAQTVEALTARILPGTPEDPGAREAGVVYYIDAVLAYREGFPEPTYRGGPYAMTFDPASPSPEAVQWYEQQGLPLPQSTSGGQSQGGQSGSEQQGQGGEASQGSQSQPTPTPPLPEANMPTPTAQALSAGAELAPSATVPPAEQLPGSGQISPTQSAAYQVIWVPADEVERYGYQSILSPRDVYRIGLAAVDRYANQQFQQDFVGLTEQQQDQVVGAMADGSATGFDKMLSASAFFHNLRRHTAEGMFADPVYGGNRDMAGWKLVGYPGAQRAYDTSEFQREGTNRAPQSITMMHPFNTGQHSSHDVILPVSGSRPDGGQPPAPVDEQ